MTRDRRLQALGDAVAAFEAEHGVISLDEVVRQQRKNLEEPAAVNRQLVWALGQARAQTLELVADLPADRMSEQSSSGDQHPAWVFGHLLLADTYLLFLMDVDSLPSDFTDQLATYGPGAMSSPDAARYGRKDELVRRLSETNARRLEGVERLTPEAFDRPLTDSVLADVQPTLGHHLLSQVFHEGYHNGQLAAWRRARGLPPVWWAFGPR